MLPSETMIWQPEFTDKTLSRKPGAVHTPFNYLFRCFELQCLSRSVV
ncbi:PapI protein [Escherichia coli]|nr:PapI protein [Escherichia coli]RZZ37367.1 PapI protein [Escherichia coli]